VPMRVTLSVQALASFTQEEILAMVPAAKLEEIRKTDEHPFFQAYCIAHEGVSTPTILGDTAKPITWFRKAVQSIKKVLLAGVKFFSGHNSDSSTEGREALGEVVADLQREVEGNLNHIVVGYFPDKARVADMDICSQEAEWDLIPTPQGFIADTLSKLTGIALSSSRDSTPAFAGARRLGMVQALESNAGVPAKETRNMPTDLTTVPFAELETEMKRRNVWPSQLWSHDEMIKKDREYKAAVDKIVADATAELTKKLTESEAKIKTLSTETVTLKRSTELVTAKQRLETIAKEQKLTDKQAAFVLARFEKGKDTLTDVSDEKLKEFASSMVDIYKDAGGETQGTPAAGTKAKEEQKKNVDPKDMTKAENNPLLVDDLEE